MNSDLIQSVLNAYNCPQLTKSDEDVFRQRWNSVITRVLDARLAQIKKWGLYREDNSLEVWNLILGEEAGEIAQAILNYRVNTCDYGEFDIEPIQNELAQVAAVAIAWLEELEGQAGK